MRYSIFAGLPLMAIVMTAFYELAGRFMTHEAAVAGGLMVSILVPISLHRWDIARLRRLLHPKPHRFPVDIDHARAFLIPTLEQIQFQESNGASCRWRLTLDPEQPLVIAGKLSMRTPLDNPNLVAWFIDVIDKGQKPKLISTRIELEPVKSGTSTNVSYDAPPLLDWSRLEAVIRENNRLMDAALLRACADAPKDVS